MTADELVAAATATSDEAVGAIAAAATLDDLDAIERSALKTRLADVKKGIKDVDGADRARVGQALAGAERAVREALDARRDVLAAQARSTAVAAERLDLSAQGTEYRRGTLHPVTQVWRELEDIFLGLGYQVFYGPEAEDDWHNFEALNLPPEHPARQMHDTFYLKPKADGTRHLLRTHTSPVQVRTMLAQKPPIRIIVPGRVYRMDSDQTHTPMFHQIEGLVIDHSITFRDLAGTIEAFTKAFFGSEFTSRLRPSYFPFTEPSAEFESRLNLADEIQLRARLSEIKEQLGETERAEQATRESFSLHECQARRRGHSREAEVAVRQSGVP